MNFVPARLAFGDRRLIEGVVNAVELLRGASREQLQGVVRHCWPLAVPRGNVIVAQGAPLPGIFAVAYGTVMLALLQDGTEEKVVRLAHAGETFGEPDALLGRTASVESRAVTECKLVVIPAAAIFALIDQDPRGARQVVRTLAERNLALLGEVRSSSMRRASQRLAFYLQSLAVPCAQNGEACTVRLPATKTVIASRLDMKKETLSRLLRSLSQQGLIQVAKRDITLLDRGRLVELAQWQA